MGTSENPVTRNTNVTKSVESLVWLLAKHFLVNNFFFLYIFIEVTHWKQVTPSYDTFEKRV